MERFRSRRHPGGRRPLRVHTPACAKWLHNLHISCRNRVPCSRALWNIEPVKKLSILFLCAALSLGTPAAGYAYSGENNPFVEAMLRMMEIFGLIDRSSLPLGVPYLPSYGQSSVPGLGGFPGLGMYPGLGGVPGMGGLPGMSSMYGLGGVPGMGPGGVPGMSPGIGGWPGNGLWGNAAGAYGRGANAASSGYLDGIWDLTNGSWVIVRRNAARLYLSRERYQDFTIGYDQRYLWWTPLRGNTTTHYLYKMRDGRMVLRDNEGKTLLMRRRS